MLQDALDKKRQAKLQKEKSNSDATVQNFQSVPVPSACNSASLKEKKEEHDRMNAHYQKLHPPSPISSREVERQQRELEEYYEEKRKRLMEKFSAALQVGYEAHLSEQKHVLLKEYQEEFLVHLLDTMHHLILKNAREVFEISSDIKNDIYVPWISTDSLHNKVSSMVTSFLKDSRAEVMSAIDDQCAGITLKSMNILSKSILDIEEFWKQKIQKDVESYHALKMQEMSYKLEEQRAKSTPIHQPQDTPGESSNEYDKYYDHMEKIGESIARSIEVAAHEIRLEHFFQTTKAPASLAGSYVSKEFGNLEESEDSTLLRSCYSNVASLRRMNLDATSFLHRMEAVAQNLRTEYTALEHSIMLSESGGHEYSSLY